MPSNKNASYRYRLIDECLTNRQRKWSLATLRQYISEKLILEFGVRPGKSGMAVSERQLLEDIALMRRYPPEGYGAPIVRKAGHIYYENPAFSIHQSPMSRQDAEALEEALLLLKQFAVFPHYRELSQVVGKLQLRLGHFQEIRPDHAVVQFDKNEILTGIEYLEPLYQCIRRKTPLLLDYQPFQPLQLIRTIFHPYLLKEYNRRWFVIGWDQSEKALRNYALDRIQAIEQVAAPWHEADDFDPATYFKDVIGVTLLEGEVLEEVLLEATPEQANYIKTKPLHPSQRTKEKGDDSTVFSFYLQPNYELESLILSFGEKVAVIKPEKLRQRILDRLKKAVRQYENLEKG